MVKGIFTLVKYKAILDENNEWVPGEIVSVQEEQNNIQYKYHDKHMLNQRYLNTSTLTGATYAVAAWVSHIPTSNILNTTIHGENSTSTLTWVSGLQEAQPFWTGGDINTDPPGNGFWTTQTRFSVPSATRYIRSVVVSSEGLSQSGADFQGARQGHLASVSLTTPCIQETDELLDVFYRIFVDISPVADGKVDASRSMANTFGQQATIYPSTASSISEPEDWSYYPTHLYCEGTKSDSSGRFNAPSIYSGGSVRQSAHSSHINMLFGHRYSVGIPASSANVTNYHGLPFRAFSVKRGSVNFITSQPVSKGTGSAVQNLFHRQADTGNFRRPFLDIDNQGSSLASLTVTDPGTWADTVNREPFVHHYRVEITTGGLVGAAEYKIRRRRGTGWNYAQYQPVPMTINTMRPPGFGTYVGPEGTDSRRFGQAERRFQQYLWPEFLTYADDGITVMHVNGEFENITADSAIPLPATGLLQLGPAYSGGERTGDIFAACENTGLWKIERPSQGPVTAITQITPAGITNPNSCRGVTVNRATGDVWAIFHDVTDSVAYLGKSTDQGTTWTLYDETTDPQFLLTDYTSGTPGPSNILGLIVNPYSVDGQLMIVAPDAFDVESNNNQAFWWSEAGASPASNQTRINLSSRLGGHLKFRNYFHNGATPLSNTEWFISGIYDTSTAFVWVTSNWFGNGRISFGASSENAGNVTTGDTEKNNLGIVGNLTYHDESTDTTYMVGYTGAALTGITNQSTGSHMPPISIRTWDQFNSAVPKVYENTSGVNLTHGHTTVLRGRNIVSNTMIGHVGNGIFLCAGSNSQPYYFLTFYGNSSVSSENAIPWFEQWGWNGTGWERNHAGSKITHATDEDLLDTLQIRFDDNGGTDPLVVGEYYDVYVYDGILLDDATAFAQTTYNYMHATGTGTDFTPGTVPAVDLGARVAEPLALAFPGWTSTEEGLTTPPAWGEPGKIIAGRGLTNSIYMENKLEGDFEFRFKMVQDGSGYIPRLGLVDWASIEANPKALTTGDAGHQFHVRYQRTGVNNVTEDLEYTVTVYTGALGGSLAATINKADGAENDIFAFRRTGTTIEFLINGVVEYTFPTATGQDLGIAMWHNMTSSNGYMGGWTLYDGEIDYAVNRRYVEVGDGVSTGAKDINFSRLISHRILTLDLNVLLDGVPAVLLNDAVTPPGPGEVNILPCSGRLWFNDADAGKTITGNWRILKKLNLE